MSAPNDREAWATSVVKPLRANHGAEAREEHHATSRAMTLLTPRPPPPIRRFRSAAPPSRTAWMAPQPFAAGRPLVRFVVFACVVCVILFFFKLD